MRALPGRFLVTLCVISILVGSITYSSTGQATEQVTLDLWVWFTGPQGPLALDAMDRALAIFESEFPHITVNVTPRTSLDQIVTAIVAGTPPDVVTLHPGMYSSLGRSGMLNEIDPLIEQLPGFDLDMITPQHQQLGVVDGTRYSLAFWDCAPTYATVYNATLFQEAALPRPDRNTVPSWADIAEYDRKLTLRDGDGNLTQIGFHPIERWNSNSETFRTLFDVELHKADGSPLLYPNKHLANAIALMYESFIEPKLDIMGLPFTRSNPFYRRETAMEVWATEIVAGRIQGFLGGDEVDAMWAPHIEQKRSQRIRGWTLGIPKGVDNVMEAMELIYFLTTDKRALELAWNIAGYSGAGLEFLLDIAQIASPLEEWFLTTIFTAEQLTWQFSGELDLRPFVESAIESIYFGDESVDNALLVAQQEAMGQWISLLHD